MVERIYENIIIRKELKREVDLLKKTLGLSSRQAVIKFLLDTYNEHQRLKRLRFDMQGKKVDINTIIKLREEFEDTLSPEEKQNYLQSEAKRLMEMKNEARNKI